MSELRARNPLDETLIQYEYLLIENCRLASQIDDPNTFVYFYGLYDEPVLKSDEHRYFKAKTHHLQGQPFKACEEVRLCLAMNPRHFWALVLMCELHFDNPKAASTDDASYALGLLSQINHNAVVHGLQSRFFQGKSAEKQMFHGQSALALFFETCPYDLDLLVFNRD